MVISWAAGRWQDLRARSKPNAESRCEFIQGAAAGRVAFVLSQSAVKLCGLGRSDLERVGLQSQAAPDLPDEVEPFGSGQSLDLVMDRGHGEPRRV
jgi:hypothetical protein